MAQHPMLPKPICLFVVLVGIFFACQKGYVPSRPVVDVVVRNAHVYTVDAQRPWAQAVAIKDDRIVWVGDERDVEAHAGPTTKVIDAAGRMLLPGFIDSHFHVLLGGNPDVLRIEKGNSLAEIQRQVRNFAEKRPDLKWIEVEGRSEEHTSELQSPYDLVCRLLLEKKKRMAPTRSVARAII